MASKQEAHSSLPGTPESYWIATTPESHYPIQAEDVEVDVAIIGGA
ncbi:MAG: hypothetical protein Q8J68_07180 [Methanolobus sp.]|nr:hypothetical protein [Methanolobus sp.]MDP2217047.1 hypothetical protein [Methanolobus sp.]